MAPAITLLTDFGTRDAYAGAMKGAILSVNPEARIIDITHEVTPYDVVEGAWLLRSAFRYFPPETIHVAVVDPGVGGARRGLAARCGGWTFVGPDNGVLSWAWAGLGRVEAFELSNASYFRRDVSTTFHGGDIFGPVAAHLASGVPVDWLGPRVHDAALLPLPSPRFAAPRADGEVIYVDRFGTLVTNLEREAFEKWRAGRGVRIHAGQQRIAGISATYADAAPGGMLALFGSAGHLEIAAREASAAALAGATRGTPVHVTADG